MVLDNGKVVVIPDDNDIIDQTALQQHKDYAQNLLDRLVKLLVDPGDMMALAELLRTTKRQKHAGQYKF